MSANSNLHADCRNRDHEGPQPERAEPEYNKDAGDDAAKRRADWLDNEDAQEILRARIEALLAVAEAANVLFQFGYIKRCEAQETLASALADLTQIGWKAGIRGHWPPLPEIKPIATVLKKL